MSTAARFPIQQVLADMRTHLLRSLASLPLIDRDQIACAITDRSGRIALADSPARLGSLQSTCDTIREYFGHELNGGDVVMTNDPYSGGTRIQDLTLLRPLECSGRRAGYALVTCPMPDLGGMALGGTYPFALEIWAEGVRVTPVLLFRKGALQSDSLTMLTLNSRLAHLVEHDALTMASCLERVADTVRGEDDLSQHLADLVERGAELTRDRLRQLPDGTYRATSSNLHQCLDRQPLSVEVALTRSGDELLLDFAGSSPASRGFANATISATRAAAARVLCQLVPEEAANAGLLSRLRLKVPEASLLDARLPLSVGGAVHSVSAAVAEAVSGALSKAGVSLPPPRATARPDRAFRVPGCGQPDCPFDPGANA